MSLVLEEVGDGLGTVIETKSHVGVVATQALSGAATKGFDGFEPRRGLVGNVSGEGLAAARFNAFLGAGLDPSSWTRLTIPPIAAKSTTGSGAHYAFGDDDRPRQRTYLVYVYRIDAVDAAGATLFHGQGGGRHVEGARHGRSSSAVDGLDRVLGRFDRR